MGASGEPSHPDELAAHRAIRISGISFGPDWVVGGDGSSWRVPVHDILATNHIDCAIDACLKGVGCARFFAYQVREQLADGRVVRLVQPYKPPPVPVSSAYPHSRLLSSRVRAFIDRAAPQLRETLIELT